MHFKVSQLAANLDPLGRVIKLSLRATMPLSLIHI